ncbi:hypothetical protein BaRGS_00006879 [Batillaria attramentaria]|uniref:Uncharacterized protein n=1 Tax=Batillaria attramentaria TaxID=370345 RepID=A0ABD0LRL5_9CAEN
MPFVIQALFKPSPEDEVDGSSLEKLIRRCALFSKSAGSFGSSAFRESIYLPRISVPSEESCTLDVPLKILSEKKSSLTPLPMLPVVLPDLCLTSCGNSISPIGDIKPGPSKVENDSDEVDENTCRSRLPGEVTSSEDTTLVDQQEMIFPDPQTDSPAPSVDTSTPEVRDESLGCNNNSSSQTKTDAEMEEDGDKDVDQSKSAMDVDDEGVWGVLHRTLVGTATNQVLYEIMSKTQDMSHMTHLLLHYVFGCRDLKRDDPKTDRRMLCLLACDELASSPFRSYLKTQMDPINMEYFDFWSCMRRFLQLQSLLTPRYVLSTDNTHELELEKYLLLQHMAGDFLPNVEGLLLSPELKERLMDDLNHNGQSSLIFVTQDVLSNVLSIPATQFAVHDVITFRGVMSSTRVPNKSAEDDKPTLTIKQTIIPPNPWAEYPASKIQGDAEKVRIEFSKFKGSTIVGVLTEQHRLLAFQYLILASEECVACAEPAVCQTDLRTTALCTVEDLTMMNWSNYGSLHIPYRTPEDVQSEVSEISVEITDDINFDDIDDIDELLQTAPEIVWQVDKMELEKPENYMDLMECIKCPDQYEFFATFLTGQKKAKVLQLQYCRTVYAAEMVKGKKLQCLDDSLVKKMSGKTAVTLKDAMEVQAVVLAHLDKRWFPRYIDGWPTDELLMECREDPNEPWLVTWQRHYSHNVGEEPDQWEVECKEAENKDTVPVSKAKLAAGDQRSLEGDVPSPAEDKPTPEIELIKKPSDSTGKSALMLMVEKSKPDKKSGQSAMAVSLARLVQAATDELQRRNVQWLDNTSYFMGRFRPRSRRNAIFVPPVDEDDDETWDLGGLQVGNKLGVKPVEKTKNISVKRKLSARTRMAQGRGPRKERLMRFALETWKFRMTLRSVHNVLRKIRHFARSLQDPLENRLFHEYLRREIYHSELKNDAYTTVDWSAHPVYFRKLLTKPPNSPGAKPIPIVVNKLTADLRFWMEVFRYKQEMVALSNSTSVGLRYEPIAQQRALTIARCYLDSDIPPKLQINISEELSASMGDSLKKRGPSVDLYYVAFMRLTPILYHFWNSFSAGWLAKMKKLTGPLARKRGSWPGTYLNYLDLFPAPNIIQRRADLRMKGAHGEATVAEEADDTRLSDGVLSVSSLERLRKSLAERKKSKIAKEQKEEPKTKDGKSGVGGKATAEASKARATGTHVSGTGTGSRKGTAVLAESGVKKSVSSKERAIGKHASGSGRPTQSRKGLANLAELDVEKPVSSKERAIGKHVSDTGTESRKGPAVLAALGVKKPVSLMKIMQNELGRAEHPSSRVAMASEVTHAQREKELSKKEKESKTSQGKVRFEEEKATCKTGKPASDKDLGVKRISVTLTAPDPEARGFQLVQDKSKHQPSLKKKLWKNVARDLRYLEMYGPTGLTKQLAPLTGALRVLGREHVISRGWAEQISDLVETLVNSRRRPTEDKLHLPDIAGQGPGQQRRRSTAFTGGFQRGALHPTRFQQILTDKHRLLLRRLSQFPQ